MIIKLLFLVKTNSNYFHNYYNFFIDKLIYYIFVQFFKINQIYFKKSSFIFLLLTFIVYIIKFRF